eukprot:TRINITY_DN2982_c0_g1_i1.p3 TRINITY_DN2982_c0_g1~~TRINITY_DN2982_c0_g1_i1.p3  ORF type:complete len:171 (-),score=9.99 TRINITY_DN2982_c0_g1_i1:137-649(-)
MSSIMKFKSIGTTFVDSSHANQNFSNLKKIVAGSIHTTASTSIMYKTILNFDLSMLYTCPIEFAHLCLYVKDINCDSSYYSNNNFCIYRNTNEFDINTITWNTTPQTTDINQISLNDNDIGTYTAIDISDIVRHWIENKKNYGITIEPHNYYSSLIKFASINSDLSLIHI